MALDKAKLTDDKGQSVTFQFNPQTISFSKSASWKEKKTQAGEDGPVKQFEGAEPIKLKLDMLLDAVEAGKSTVTDSVNTLASWTNPTEKSLKDKTPAPPELKFSWGRFKIGQSGDFKCHLKSVSVNYTMFRSTGEPLRAKVSVDLSSTQTIKWGQNPTSGGLRPQRRHVLQRGDRLAVIAASEYGRADYWRHIARFNGIDDPFTLPVGRQILLPSKQDLGET